MKIAGMESVLVYRLFLTVSGMYGSRVQDVVDGNGYDARF